MKKITDLTKRAMKWYFNQYTKCYNDKYYRYVYRVY